MEKKIMKTYGVMLIVVLAVCVALLILLSEEGTSGLWVKIIRRIITMWVLGMVGLRFMNKNMFQRAIPHVVLWSVVFVLTILISIPCIEDFFAVHEVRELPLSSCIVTSTHHQYFIILADGEKCELSAKTYFSLLGQKDCILRVEYYPNTKTVVSVSGYDESTAV